MQVELCLLISATDLTAYPYGFCIYNGGSPKPVGQRLQGLIQAHNFYFTNLNEVDLPSQMCVKNIHISLATLLQVTC